MFNRGFQMNPFLRLFPDSHDPKKKEGESLPADASPS